MFWTILKYLFYALLAYIAYKEFLILSQIKRLSKSGKADIMYFPLIGLIFHYLFSKKNKDSIKWIKERVNTDNIKKKKMILTNFLGFDKPIIIAIDPKLIGEIYSKELEITSRKDVQPDGVKLMNTGFFYDYSPHALAMRGAFTEIFRDENMIHIAPAVSKIVEKRLLEIYEEKMREGGIGDEFVDVDLKPVYPLFNILLGYIDYIC